MVKKKPKVGSRNQEYLLFPSTTAPHRPTTDDSQIANRPFQTQTDFHVAAFAGNRGGTEIRILPCDPFR
ncbi:hypothetical protein L596_013641 [Steinernema carpocapsae]|uniref:Uncharacterized protein n=1 Tax=Steinernema carpocapsae TaxID=34508 RepID=A0A4U5P0T5_STECR|nr:hypothetical protein L596_013641 [Steinernema carpocapsae]